MNIKIHRRFIPKYKGNIPQGLAKFLTSHIEYHNWDENKNLIKLRQKGYTPYKKIFDKNFKPKPMRNKLRKESKQALTSLLITLVCNCNFYFKNKYLFEIFLSIEKIAELMGTLYIYSNGRKSYDITLHALRLLEELKFILIYRNIDHDSGQWKPMRIFLTDTLFKSLKINDNRIAFWLLKTNNYFINKKIDISYKKNYIFFLQRMKRLNINLKNSLLEKKIIFLKNKYMLIIKKFFLKKKKIEPSNIPKINNLCKYEKKWINWYNSKHYLPSFSLIVQKLINEKYPNLFNINKNEYYRIFIKNLNYKKLLLI